MKKRLAIIITATLFAFQPALQAGNFTDDPSYKDEYSWDLTDSDQKKIACGMVIWGFFLVLASALISGFVPNSTAPATNVK